MMESKDLLEFAKYVREELYKKDRFFTLYDFKVIKQDFLGNFFIVYLKVLVKETLYTINRFVEVKLGERVFEKFKETLESDFEKF